MKTEKISPVPSLKIHYAIGNCSLGSILAGMTEVGLCTILLGDDPGLLELDLHRRFPKAELIDSGSDLKTVINRVIALVNHPNMRLNLPLDLLGTAFQKRVWQALCEIPAGRTATYSEIASRIGKPEAVRAVAGACAANNLAVAVPCHRVIRTDGNLAGYRWGLERKRSLLELESRQK